MVILSVLAITLIILCVFQTYLARLRPWICDQFYPEKVIERAQHLHKELEEGRKERGRKIHSIVAKELKRRQETKVSIFMLLFKLKYLLRCLDR